MTRLRHHPGIARTKKARSGGALSRSRYGVSVLTSPRGKGFGFPMPSTQTSPHVIPGAFSAGATGAASAVSCPRKALGVSRIRSDRPTTTPPFKKNFDPKIIDPRAIRLWTTQALPFQFRGMRLCGAHGQPPPGVWAAVRARPPRWRAFRSRGLVPAIGSAAWAARAGRLALSCVKALSYLSAGPSNIQTPPTGRRSAAARPRLRPVPHRQHPRSPFQDWKARLTQCRSVCRAIHHPRPT